MTVVVGPYTGRSISKATLHGTVLYGTLQLYHVIALSFGIVGLSELNLDTTDSLACCSSVAVATRSVDQTCTCSPVVTVRIEQVAGHVVKINCLTNLVGRERRDLRSWNRWLLPNISVDSLCDNTAREQQSAQNK